MTYEKDRVQIRIREEYGAFMIGVFASSGSQNAVRNEIIKETEIEKNEAVKKLCESFNTNNVLEIK